MQLDADDAQAEMERFADVRPAPGLLPGSQFPHVSWGAVLARCPAAVPVSAIRSSSLPVACR